MCIICVSYNNEKITIEEAKKHYGEMKYSIDEKHRKEVEELIEYGEYEPNWSYATPLEDTDVIWSFDPNDVSID